MFRQFLFRSLARKATTPLRQKHIRGHRIGFEPLEARAMMTGDSILHWNAIALDVVKKDHTSPDGVAPPLGENTGPTKASRALAIVHVAMFDAINSIKGKYEPYLIKVVGVEGANIDAAVGQAAHDTLVSLYKKQKSEIDAELVDWLNEIKNGKAENMGIALGKVVAKAMIDDRKNDGSTATSDYHIVNLPGHHQKDPLNPTQGLLDPQWGGVDPFGIKQAEKFLPPPPPKLNSPEYTAAFNELLKYGGDGVTTPTQRTAEQTEIGIFWAYDGTQGLCAPPRMYNQIAETIARNEHNSEYENARMFALINVAMADAGIVAWDSKYIYDQWRPVVGIRNADVDGNPNTQAIANWTPLGAPASNETFPNDFTPPFPSYVSGHAVFGAALFKTLEYFYGTKYVPFTCASDEFNGTTTNNNGVVRPEIVRHFDNLRDAAYENGISRIYLGIHWRFDMTAGIDTGNRIAVNIFKNIMEPLKHAMPAGSMNNLLMSYFQASLTCKVMDYQDGRSRDVVVMQTIVTPQKTTFKFSSASPTFVSTSSTFSTFSNGESSSHAAAARSSALNASALDDVLAT